MANVYRAWRGAVEPASQSPSGNEYSAWRGAVEPLATVTDKKAGASSRAKAQSRSQYIITDEKIMTEAEFRRPTVQVDAPLFQRRNLKTPNQPQRQGNLKGQNANPLYQRRLFRGR